MRGWHVPAGRVTQERARRLYGWFQTTDSWIDENRPG